MAIPKLLEAACKGTHLPDDDGSDDNFVYGGPRNADGPAVRTGAWIADVTYDEPSSAPPFGQPVTFTATVSNSEPVTHAGWGPWEDNPSNASPPVDYGTGSFIIQNVSDPATIDASLVFDSTGGDRSTVLLPYLEQRGGEADDGGFVIDWTTGDGPKGGDTVGVIAIITPTEHGSSILEFSVENFPNNSSDTPDTLSADVGGQFYARESAPGVGCDDLISGDNSASPAPLESRGYRAGHFALEIEGQFASHLSLYDLIV